MIASSELSFWQLLALAPLVILIWYGFRFIRFRQHALSLHWPRGLTNVGVSRYANYYLKKHGWKLLDDPPRWAKIHTAATKDGQRLNLIILDNGVLPLSTQMKDADYAAHVMNEIVLAAMYGFSSDDFRDITISRHVLLIEPHQLRDAVTLLKTHKAALEKK